MLTLELSGQRYNKSEHRRALAARLDGRSEGAIERKHQNISQVLLELECPYIAGYKPLPHYQQLLFEVVQERLAADELFDRAALTAVEQPAAVPLLHEPAEILVEPPPIAVRVVEPARPRYASAAIPVRRDYLAREARNRSLGMAGELFVAEFESRRLHALGLSRLSERVEHVSRTRGDGLGYDVLSFDADGRERYIEVKTTAFGQETPFYVSRNELACSDACREQFQLYRVFEFRRAPKLFMLPGRIDAHCLLDPVSWLARFG
ncbi:DUF3883 domain-containing protein [Vulcaniibacterium gelatinicum]|uniref:DUF3883 domain-containing protein n=1 Tax=Vulcaniibacterium gelatinicum TaxID=2598725 RepID=UPI001FE5380B|nr:DUF3883 domain-containing protein [Vulcaniibacterium gelatinicum]